MSPEEIKRRLRRKAEVEAGTEQPATITLYQDAAKLIDYLQEHAFKQARELRAIKHYTGMETDIDQNGILTVYLKDRG